VNNVWYIKRGTEVFGPAQTERVQEMVKSGQLSTTDEAAASWEGPFAPISNIAALKPVRPISEIGPAANQHSPTPQAVADTKDATPQPTGLPADVRNEYLTALSEKGEAWVFVPTMGIIGGGLVYLFFRLGFKSGWALAVAVLIALVITGVVVGFYKRERALSLGEKSDKMLEVMYQEHQRAKLVSRIFDGIFWVALIAAVAWWAFWRLP
jgi:hypothetical protein